MNFSSVLFIAIAIVTSSYAFVISSDDDRDVCPPRDQIAPCTCFRARYTKRVTALFENFTDAMDIERIFEKNPSWKIEDVHIDQCVMSYLPAVMLEKARFQSLNVSSTTLYTLFDVTPVKTPELNLYLHNVKLLRGFEWTSIANSNLKEFMTFGLVIRHFGKEFIDNIPDTVKGLWFENSKTVNIAPKAFAKLSNLEVLTITGGSIKKISRDMLPKAAKLFFLDFR
ncbi:uncharacterized protein NPIL_556371 [Nephila pilipes]|uniref:Uncharacterized protein n=1 Tax=Nephila pilipes TaxID=299642 RepID=A0A8X6NMB3_NEPPI|nr:uncharacterized protein NPIL_556371 [Nephila pilipes]